MDKKYFTVEDLIAYQIASELSDYIWKIVSEWDWFGKRTIGAQYTSSVDSVAANIAEGFGRYHKRDKMKFYYNARASLFEAIHWTKKAKNRRLLSKKDFDCIMENLEKLPKEINVLIKLTNEHLKK